MATTTTNPGAGDGAPVITINDVDDLFDRLAKLTRPMEERIRDLEHRLEPFEILRAQLDHEKGKLKAIYEAVAGPTMQAAFTAQPYDKDLKEILQRMPTSESGEWNSAKRSYAKKPIAGVAAWSELKAKGANDDQIRRNLRVLSQKNGSRLAAGDYSIDGYADKPSLRHEHARGGKAVLTFDQLVKETRRVMAIPEPKAPTPPAKKPAPKSAAKKSPAKKKPAAAATSTKAKASAAADDGSGDWIKKFRAALDELDFDRPTAGLTLDNPSVEKLHVTHPQGPRFAAELYAQGEARTLPPTEPAKPKSLPGYRAQTYGQWLATLRGISPKGADLGGTDAQADPSLVKIYDAKKGPSEAKQILIAAGWFEASIADDENTEEVLKLGSAAMLEGRVWHIESALARGGHLPAELRDAEREKKKCRARQAAMRTWEQAVRSIGVELRGAMTEAPKAAAEASSSRKHGMGLSEPGEATRGAGIDRARDALSDSIDEALEHADVEPTDENRAALVAHVNGAAATKSPLSLAASASLLASATLGQLHDWDQRVRQLTPRQIQQAVGDAPMATAARDGNGHRAPALALALARTG